MFWCVTDGFQKTAHKTMDDATVTMFTFCIRKDYTHMPLWSRFKLWWPLEDLLRTFLKSVYSFQRINLIPLVILCLFSFSNCWNLIFFLMNCSNCDDLLTLYLVSSLGQCYNNYSIGLGQNTSWNELYFHWQQATLSKHQFLGRAGKEAAMTFWTFEAETVLRTGNLKSFQEWI